MSNWRRLAGQFVGIAIAGSVGAIAASSVFAQSVIVPDETLGNERSVVIPIDIAPVDAIGGGAIRGRNLFHSFQEFNVASGRGGYFFNPDNSIQNILARVTGQNRSEILGTLGIFQSQDVTSRPNLFLINANGILFGPNAYLDVGGSFVATTANSIQFGDQGIFSASVPQLPTPLLTINPSAFLFNAIAKPEIINQARATESAVGFRWNLPVNASGLQVPDGRSLILLGGNVTLDGNSTTASGGRIELGGLAASGTVGLDMNDNNLMLQFPATVARGDVMLRNGAIADVRTTTNGGNLIVTARNVDVLAGSQLEAGILQGQASDNRQAGDITINATERVNVSGQSRSGQLSAINNVVYSGATGNSGSISIIAKLLVVNDGGQIVASTFGIGNSGNLTIRAIDSVNLIGESSSFSGGLFTSVQASGKGLSGNLSIETNRLSISDGSTIFTGMLGEGNAGNLFINTNNLSLSNGGVISASTLGKGNAGNINIQVNGAVSLVGANTSIVSNVQAQTALGNAGNITITADSVSAQGGAQINSFTRGQGNAGNIVILAPGAIAFDGVDENSLPSGVFNTIGAGAVGNGGILSITAGSLSLINGASLNAFVRGASDPLPGGSGIGGTIDLHVKNDLTISKGGIFTSLYSGAVGSGGDLNIRAGSLFIKDGGEIEASTFGKGDAGNILIQTNRLRVIGGSTVSTSTSGIGNSGNLTIRSTDFIELDGDTPLTNDGRGGVGGLLAQVESLGGTVGKGQGGNIFIETGHLSVSNGSKVQAATFGDGNAGNIFIRANEIDVFTTPGRKLSFTTAINAGVTRDVRTVTPPKGNGGTLTIRTGRLSIRGPIEADRRTEVTVNTAGEGNAGKAQIYANVIEVIGGKASLTANVTSTAEGKGGDLLLNTRELKVLDGGRVSVGSDGKGIAGNLEVNAQTITLDNQAAILGTTTSGQGGNITLNVGKLLLLRRGSSISATAGTDQVGGNGGNIAINSGFIIAVPKENSDITANAFSGAGGNITINSPGIFGLKFRPKLTELSDITASSDFGVSGTIDLNAPDNTAIQNSLTQLSQNLTDPNTLLANSCIVRDRKQNGTFLITGSGGLPVRPGDAPPSSFPTGEVRSLPKPANGEQETGNSRSWKLGDPIVEPQGIYRLPNGKLVMSRECENQ